MSTRCDECREWSSDFMAAYLQHKKSLDTKRGKKTAAASTGSSQLAVTASPSLSSSARLPSFADDNRLIDAVLSALQTLFQSGSLGTNLFFFRSSPPCT